MKKALTVARWEYIEKVKSKAFIISLLLTPAMMLAMGILPTMMASRPDTETKVVGIIDQSGKIFEPLSTIMDTKYRLPNGQPNYILRSFSVEGSADLGSGKREADSLVLAEELEGYFVIGKSIMTDTMFEYHSQNVGNFKITERFNSAVRDIIVEKKLKARGFDPTIVKDLTSPIDLKTLKLTKSGKEEESGFEQVFFTAYGFMMMMFFLIMTSGQLLVRSMLEEKSNRVVEVLMSSCSANQLMAGKVIGLSLLGLTQMSLWVIIGVVISVKFAVTLIALPGASFSLPILFLDICSSWQFLWRLGRPSRPSKRPNK